MRTLPTHEHERLERALAQSGLVVCLGPGVSAAAGLPARGGLVRALIARARRERREIILRGGDLARGSSSVGDGRPRKSATWMTLGACARAPDRRSDDEPREGGSSAPGLNLRERLQHRDHPTKGPAVVIAGNDDAGGHQFAPPLGAEAPVIGDVDEGEVPTTTPPGERGDPVEDPRDVRVAEVEADEERATTQQDRR